MEEFNYIIEKIRNAPIIHKPFPHLEIENFLKPEHLEIVLSDNQIHFKPQINTKVLIDTLHSKGYQLKSFPGCHNSVDHYLATLDKGHCIAESPEEKINLIEGKGVTFRLYEYKNQFIRRLINFMNGPKFHNALREKFHISRSTKIISAIQKYLTNYEISPHPDIRSKALTYLLNINYDDEMEHQNIHTHLLEFKSTYEPVYEFWRTEKHFDRCWVPWSWCESRKIISKNNTLIIFRPNHDTLHAVKLDYDHTKKQRTQIYGNLMYSQGTCETVDYRFLEKHVFSSDSL